MTDSWPSYQSAPTMPRDQHPDFNRLSRLIGSNIQKIQNNVSQVNGMVEKLGTLDDDEDLRAKLHEVQHFTNNLAKDANRMLKELANLNSATEQRQWKVQRDRLTNDLMVVLNNFQTAQRAAAQKEKESMLRARANSREVGGPSLSLFDEEDEFDRSAVASEAVAPQTRLQLEQNVNVEDLQEREQAIKQLESDIVDVNQIFKDLAIMVHEQGETVDSIEANVETAATEVDQAHVDIRKAADLKRSVRKKRFFCIALLVILVAIIIIVIWVSLKNGKK